MFKLDLSKFKKVSSDKDKTTLKHELGHVIQIAHVALSPKTREQLHALPMAKGGDPTQQHLLPGDKLPNSIERGVVNQARARMADGGKPNDQISGLGPDKPGSDAYKQHAAMQQGAGYPAPDPAASPDPYKMAEGGQPVPGSKYPNSQNIYSEPQGPSNFQPKPVPGSKYPTSTGQYGAGTGGKSGSKAMPDDRDEAFAKGGFVNNPKLAESKKQPPKTAWSSINQQEQDDRQPMQRFADGGMPMYANGAGDVNASDAVTPDQPSQAVDMPQQSSQDVANQQAGPQDNNNAAPAAPVQSDTPDQVRTKQLYNNAIVNKANAWNTEVPIIPKDQMFGPNGEPPQNFDADTWTETKQAAAAQNKQQQQAVLKFQQDNAARMDAGLQPLPIPADLKVASTIGMGAPTPTLGGPNKATNAQMGPNEPNDMPGIWKEGYQQQMQGLSGEANAAETTENAKYLALQHASAAEGGSAEAQWTRSQQLLNEAHQVNKEINEGYITKEDLEPPGGNGFLNHLKTAIGMALGGAGAWSTGSNMYADWINRQIDRQVDRQKSNAAIRSNVMTHYGQMLGDNDKAAQMYSGILHNAAADMVEGQGAKYNNLAAQSVKNIMQGQLRQKGAMMLSMAAGSGTAGMPGQGGAPNARMISQMEMNPDTAERAKELRSRYEPLTDSIAATPLTEGDHNQIAAAQTFQDAVQHAIEFANQNRGKIVGQAAARGNVIQGQLTNAYRSITGGGKSAAEMGFIDNIIPSNLTSPVNQWSTIPKLQEIAKTQKDAYETFRKSKGLPPANAQAPQVMAPGSATKKTFKPFGQ